MVTVGGHSYSFCFQAFDTVLYRGAQTPIQHGWETAHTKMFLLFSIINPGAQYLSYNNAKKGVSPFDGHDKWNKNTW